MQIRLHTSALDPFSPAKHDTHETRPSEHRTETVGLASSYPVGMNESLSKSKGIDTGTQVLDTGTYWIQYTGTGQLQSTVHLYTVHLYIIILHLNILLLSVCRESMKWSACCLLYGPIIFDWRQIETILEWKLSVWKNRSRSISSWTQGIRSYAYSK